MTDVELTAKRLNRASGDAIEEYLYGCPELYLLKIMRHFGTHTIDETKAAIIRYNIEHDGRKA